MRIGPLASDQAAVPAQDGAWVDQPVRSQPCRHEPGQPQHEQLGVLGGRSPAEQDQPAADPDEDEIEQAHGRRMIMMPYDSAFAIAAGHRACRLLAPHRPVSSRDLTGPRPEAERRRWFAWRRDGLGQVS